MMSIDKNQVLNTALKFHHSGELNKADELYLKVIEHDKNDFNANHLHGCILSAKNRHHEAITFLLIALKIKPTNYEVNNNLGITYKNLQDSQNAEKFFLKAINIDKTKYKSFFNCANLYIDTKEYDKSIQFLESARKCEPKKSDIIQRLGEVYQYKYQESREKGILNLAEKCFIDVLEIDPVYVNASIMLGINHLWNNNIVEANVMFQNAHKIIHSEKNQIDFNIKKYLNDKKSLETLIKHEFEQITHIDNDMDEIRNPKFTKEYYTSLKNLYNKVMSDSFHEDDISYDFKKEILKPLYNKPPKIISSEYINRKIDIQKYQKTYKDSKPELVVIDDFLCSSQLAELQKFCRNANIFKYPYKMGYVGAFLSKGMSSEFILNLSEDLRKTFNLIFKDYQLTQAWIFKYDNTSGGTKIHADQASVNVNLWITPDEANQSKESGGLIVWNKIPPSYWSFKDYNSIDSYYKIEQLLGSEGIEKKIIPYKENRCVIFNSKLFHCTDNFKFNNSYPHRRVNITLLYD